MDDNVPGKICFDAWKKSTRPELRKGVVTPIWRHHIVRGLCPSVITDNHPRLLLADEEVCQQPFARISKPQVNDDEGTQGRDAPDLDL